MTVFESESNNKLTRADAVALGAEIRGRLASRVDVDYYKVVTSAAGSLSVVFDAPTASLYSDYFQLGVYDEVGTLLANFSTGSDSQYTVGAPAGGVYYVGIASDSFNFNAGQYGLSVSHLADTASGYESESNDRMDSANAVALNVPVAGQLASPFDIDFYKVLASPEGSLSVDFDVPTERLYSDYFQLAV